MHLTIGTAGARLDNVQLIDNTWTAQLILQTYGYGRVTIWNATSMQFQFVQHGDSSNPKAGSVLDDVWILRDRK